MQIKKFILFLLTILAFSITQMKAAEIPEELVGTWVTLKTENGWYFYALEEGGQIKLGQTKIAPKPGDDEASRANPNHYSRYCWLIEKANEGGYTFRCLRYEYDGDGKKYITNPSYLGTWNYEVLLTTSASRYEYTSNHQLKLIDAPSDLYLAMVRSADKTIRLYDGHNYVGSKMIIGGIYDWNVAAVVFGTETEDGDGHPQGTYLPNGGISFNGQNYVHGSSITLSDPSQSYTQIAIDGYNASSVKIDNDNHYIVSYYVGKETGKNYKNATLGGENAVTGENNTIWALDAKDYITNLSGNYTNVPVDKAWQMEMVVENLNKSGNDPSFNEWGSCILSSCGDPVNSQYWGNFQVYQHSPTHSSPNTLNFKSSKGDGLDHIIAEGHSVANKNYKVIVRYAGGGNVYLIRTIMLDNDLEETQEVYNNVWVSARQQLPISQMSCALPTGINLKSLRISIAEECGLLEGADYAIQNIGIKHYISIGDDQSFQHYRTADHASKFQIEYTGNQDLAYHDKDGGLHATIYLIVEIWDTQAGKVIRKYVGPKDKGVWTLVDYGNEHKAEAQPFLYSATSKHIQAVINTGSGEHVESTLGDPWAIDGNDEWLFDFFATFQLDIRKNGQSAASDFGGFTYKKTTKTNGQYIDFPANADIDTYPNKSELGYSASISKDAIFLKVQYNALENTFYNIKAWGAATPSLFYWNKSANKLVTYSTTNSQSGIYEEWGEKGNCAEYTITKATEIPMKMSQIGEKYYNTVYCPNALTLPTGVKAYRLKEVTDGKFIIKEVELTNNVLPANSPVVLISDAAVAAGNWAISTNATTPIADNKFLGVFEQTNNPGAGQGTESNVFILGNKSGIGFYHYTAAKIPAFKVYYVDEAAQALYVPQNSTKMFAINFDEEEVTPVSEVEEDNIVRDNAEIYDLTGRRVSTLKKSGLYIINGKKVLVK